jgi:hypothetical protein
LDAAGSDDGGGGSDAGATDGGGASATIYDVQTPGGAASAVGTPVALAGVVVTAVDRFGARTGDVWVEEAGGGPYSGVVVVTPAVAGGTIDDVQPGDVVDVTGGVVDEVAAMGDTSGETRTSVVAPTAGAVTITVTGAAAVPGPDDVDRAVLGDPAVAESWEGVLIRVADVASTRDTHGVSAMDPTLAEMEITGPSRVASALAPLLTDPPAAAPLYPREQCFTSITGIGDYFFAYRLLPRDPSDIVTAADGSACLHEDSVAVCHEGTDEDLDGYIDCDDFSCQAADPACVADVTIQDVQMDLVPTGSLVMLTDVLVTAVHLGGPSAFVWVEEPGGGEYGGVLTRPAVAPAPGALVAGDVVTVEGEVDEVGGETQLVAATITETGTMGAPSANPIADGSILVGAATAEPWEGVLVELTNVPVTGAPDTTGVWTVGAYLLPVGALMVAAPASAAPGNCAVDLVGVLQATSAAYLVEPRSPADISVLPGACP